MTLQVTHLTREDVRTRAIENLVADMRERLAGLRIDNDSRSDNDDAAVTARRRGRIAELKDWLDLLAPPQPQPAGDDR